jgi:hypothetical protein
MEELLEDDVDLIIVNTPGWRIMNMQNKSFGGKHMCRKKLLPNGC